MSRRRRRNLPATRGIAAPRRRKQPQYGRPGRPAVGMTIRRVAAPISAGSTHRLLQIAVELVEELIGGEPWVIRTNQCCRRCRGI